VTDVDRERRGPIQILRISRPEARNALNRAVLSEIGHGLQAAERDPDVRTVVITASGERTFSAGMDLREFVAGSTGGASESELEGIAAYRSFQRNGLTKPVIGAANGTAVAGGFELLLACDLVVASEDALFGLPEVKRALFPAGGGVFLSRRIPRAIALELTLTGSYIDAARALQLGLINRVVPASEVLDEALGLAEQIAGNGPIAVAVTKRLVMAASVQPADEVWALQDQLHPTVFQSDDAREGAAAFLERRPPEWTGH
jgi:enoyl-CoA hydratase